MTRLKPYIEYIKSNSSESDSNNYQKAVRQFIEKEAHKNNYQGISNVDLLVGMKFMLKSYLNTRSAVFLAATLSFDSSQILDLENIELSYGREVRRIVDGILKVRKVSYLKALEQADMQRKLVLSLARDTRSLLILLSENHYLLKNYDSLTNIEEKLNVLNSAITVFIPVAHRLGFYKIKSEMEDLVLSIREPEIYDGIQNKLAESAVERNKIINKFIAPLILEMNAQRLQYAIKSRLKSIQSIYNKMKKQNIPFEKVYDLWAIRIILEAPQNEEKAACWHAYSIVTNIYEASLSRLRDWITVPKASGYESLHTTVKDEDGRWTEVQIRTSRMDEEAESGMAAHWKYKGGQGSKGIDFWLSEIRKAIEDESGNSEYHQVEPDKFAQEVFVFTPGGDLKKLKFGATVLDFAYSIHSEVGNKCTNARVNGKVVPIKHILKNGDQVEIITSKNQKPNIDWLSFVASTRTKTKIRKALDEERTKEIKRGKEILERKFKNWKIDLNQDTIGKLVEELKLKEHYDLYLNVSLEKLDPLLLKKILLGEQKEQLPAEWSETPLQEVEENELDSSHKDVLIIDKIDQINFKLAKCCNPIQGDKIFGFVTVTKGITIHRNSCPNALEMKKRFSYRIIEARWRAGNKKVNFKTGIRVLGTDSMGLANRITQMISNELKVNIMSMNFNSKNGLVEGKIGLLVHDNEHLEHLIEKMRSINGVTQVFRIDA
jgi:guanosine-3',5'-bis(diphosphate) 3'-pyrophosphohydrolase